MLSKNLFHKSVSLVTLAAVWCVFSMVALAAQKDLTGEITVTGQVTVNGSATVSNATVVSGSVITTGDNSTATISLGKVGRIEILANSSLTLRFSQTDITGILSQGKARVMNSAGIATTVTTKNATILADSAQSNSFAVDVECSHTHVDTLSGLVTMREGTNDRQVAAGTDAVAGNLSQTGCKPCLRPDTAPVPVASIGSLPLAALLLLIGGAVGTAILLGGGNDTDTTDTVIVPSPVR